MSRKIALLLLAASLLLLAGCSATGKLPVEYDETAKTLKPTSDQSLVYIVRPAGKGMSSKFSLYCDGEYLGATGGKRYLYTLADPGPHTFMSKAENESELPIVLEGGQVYYLEQKVKFGIVSARNKLERLPDAEGREKLAKCALSDDITAIVPGAEQYMKDLAIQKKKAAEDREKSRSRH